MPLAGLVSAHQPARGKKVVSENWRGQSTKPDPGLQDQLHCTQTARYHTGHLDPGGESDL